MNIDNFTHIISNAKLNGKLIIKNLGVKSLPKNNLVLSFNDINYIDISENKFTTIPEIISEFHCLEILFCSHNNIRSFSSSITNLIYLETLDLSCNHLTSLPSSVCKLECLKILLISSNRLVSLPKCIGNLTRLEELDASCNSLTCLPEELSTLRQLKFLNVRHNKLLDVSINLSLLTLEVLDLSENQLSSIPSEYHRIETLQSFNLSGNPLTFPPANVCNRGLLHIMKYLQSEFRRQNQRQRLPFDSQSNTTCTTLNNNLKSESINLTDNTQDDSVKSTSTSYPSVVDLDPESPDSSKYKYIPQAEFVNRNFFKDSGYNTISHSTKMDSIDKYQDEEHKLEDITVERNSPNAVPTSLSYREEFIKTSDRTLGRQFKKNKNYCSTLNPISQVVSPQAYRSTRFNSRVRQSESTKVRRNSLPNDDFVGQPNNFANQDVDNLSECVVVVDNANNDGLVSRHSSQVSQSNNSNVSNLNNNSAYSSMRSLKSKNYESFLDRRNSAQSQTNGRIAEHDGLQSQDLRNRNNETIKRFHKIIEAQLHVHINSKDLSKELSNGIYLCHLAKYLIPNCIAVVHTPSPGQRELGKQKSKRNLENFLETCRRNGVTEEFLFSPRDVVNCNPLSLLQMAKSVEALMHSIRVKKSRPTTTNCKPWRDVLANPQSLSKRIGNFQYQPRSSSGSNTNTVYRSHKSPNVKPSSPSSKLPNEEIIQISSEV